MVLRLRRQRRARGLRRPALPPGSAKGAWRAGVLVVKLCGGFEVYVEGRRIGDALRAKPAVLYL
jgi:hypothetical protein